MPREERPDNLFTAFFGQGKLKAGHYVQLVGEADMGKEFDFGLSVEPAGTWAWLKKLPFYQTSSSLITS